MVDWKKICLACLNNVGEAEGTWYINDPKDVLSPRWPSSAFHDLSDEEKQALINLVFNEQH